MNSRLWDFRNAMLISFTLRRSSWPSLFISPAGLSSELHVDAFASHFFMVLLEGRKRWTFFPAEAVPHLRPALEQPDGIDPVFNVHKEKLKGML